MATQRDIIRQWITGDFHKRHDFAQVLDMLATLDDLVGLPVEDHDHAISDITGLALALDALDLAIAHKANTTHGHAIADVTGLQMALDGKINLSPKAAAIANIATTATADSIAILGINVPTNASYVNLVAAHNALKDKVNTILAALRSRGIIEA